ncbi:L,D-transpeptidase family protein [Sphingomonas sp. LY29]|uniref:L,D-transpeptidase family protein n=1 Tax=Sphingomonas sp. LY29 TaxID=3095341 RepID=UPI002D794D23|nr:L,D-transpeptidase family protein [Sphingomonas sp. LY29]WRP25906.1 L,D-transpeptidase family protein [Sphingomonas sp. LY29]
MLRFYLAASVLALSLGACTVSDGNDENSAAPVAETAEAGSSVDAMGSNDNATAAPAAEDKARPLMQAQVVLDRLGFTPGVVDGKMGLSTVNAIKGFQESRDMEITGKLDAPTQQALAEWQRIPATRVVTITPEFANDQYIQIPEDRKEQAKLPKMGYASLAEKLAERFHTTEAVLAELNPQMLAGGQPQPVDPTATENASAPAPAPAIAYAAGMEIRVPNIGADRFDAASVKDANWSNTLRMLGVGTAQPTAAKIVVDKSDEVLRVLDANGKLLAQFTATMGSKEYPLPLGTWKIQGTAYNPPWQYNPALLSNADKSDPKLEIPAGPNNPIGIVWMDLSKEHYGIHGTDSPDRIGRAESNGCIRLTNWDAARLAQMIKPGIEAVFQA